jgi:hypothetical protein
VDACWSDVWIGVPELSHPHDDPPADWSAFCVVPARLPAPALDAAVFDCVTEPSLPGLRTRIGTFVLLGASCAAAESATASWSVPADCCDDWTPPPPAAAWSAFCVVELRLPAPADEAALFDCETAPSLPGLSTRIAMLVLLGATCVALEPATACCEVVADCPET